MSSTNRNTAETLVTESNSVTDKHSGMLVAPLNAVLTDKYYWLVSMKGMENRNNYKIFANWLR
ncbi:hypothetical protein UA31_06290 [Photobacterium angustum]|nr:hypothetical protein UA35_04290 [Photobacterium angustum]KJG46378.1 hypothetical protein UA31_06290 [Photobacterium angustum]KJG50516.1 hypothetical protein UA30_00845 [Photobacterium angustum]KJG54386.1 hypothetical protein UA34_00855 [Photobacterium angustum]